MAVLKALSIVHAALRLFHFASRERHESSFNMNKFSAELFDTHPSLCNVAFHVNSATNRFCNYVCMCKGYVVSGFAGGAG